MDPDVVALFRELVDRSVSERAEIYAQRKTPTAVRIEVESLLRFDAETEQSFTGDIAATAEKVFAEPKSFGPGINIGPYKITGSIGAGGMGEVYRAHDPRLGRDVAIKVLRQRFTTDPDRLRRFEQEARAAAALNHPNIVAIHDFGTTAHSVPYLVSELLEGENLRQRLQRGAVPLRRAVEYALQMLRGLAAAHDKGIVHRDLKPENLFLTKDGLVKILDLGLAKLVSQDEPADDPMIGTVDGIVMGTVGYMSPEQALGEKVDHRADIFAVGAIVHEMLSGARAFQGETPAAVMKAAISEDPEDLSNTGRIPIALERVIQRCLEKNPSDRFQSSRDVAFALEAVSSGGMDEQHLIPPTPARPRRRGVILAVAALVFLVAAASYMMRLRRVQPARVSLDDLQIVQLTTTGRAERPAISPDGKYVVYVQHDGDAYSLRIHQIATGSDVEIVSAQAGGILFGATVTPDGAFVDFIRQGQGRRELLRVPFLGGTPKRLIDSTEDAVVETTPGWSPDGKYMAFVRVNTAQSTSELVVAEADGAHKRTLATRRAPARFDSLMLTTRPNLPPAWSLDGRLIATSGWDGKETHVAIFDAATGSERNIPAKDDAVTGLTWLDSDSLVLNQPLQSGAPSQLLRLSYPDGRISRLSNDPNTYAGVSVTSDRTSLVTARSETRVGVWIGDAAGSRLTELSAPTLYPYSAETYSMLAWSASQLVYTTARGENLSISRTVPGKGTPEEIVTAASTPVATWDGSRIAFLNLKTDTIWKADADGSHAVELVHKRGMIAGITPDDKVIFLSNESGIQAPWIVSMDGGSPTEIAHVFAFGVDVSPDGGSIAFRSRNEQNNIITRICDLPACRMPRTLPPLGLPSPLRWTPDGHLAYVPRAAPSNIWVQPRDGAKPHQLTHFGDTTIVDFAWSRDGKRLAIARSSSTNDIVLFKGLKKQL